MSSYTLQEEDLHNVNVQLQRTMINGHEELVQKQGDEAQPAIMGNYNLLNHVASGSSSRPAPAATAGEQLSCIRSAGEVGGADTCDIDGVCSSTITTLINHQAAGAGSSYTIIESALNPHALEFVPAGALQAAGTVAAGSNHDIVDGISTAGGGEDIEPKTTLMIRNIPNKLLKVDLMALLDEFCAKDDTNTAAYDFLYVVMDHGTKLNRGYAFVNFTTSEATENFKEKFHDKYHWSTNFRLSTKKICETTYARIQGVSRLREEFVTEGAPDRRYDHYEYDVPTIFVPPRMGRNYGMMEELFRDGCSYFLVPDHFNEF